MAVKDSAKHVIDTLPDNTSMDGIIHALYIKAKFDRGESQVREGRGVTHEEARRRLQKWAK
ncbi:MAG: hypothetical protein P9M08_00250 [Candidatus Erginobacter occultus]|nr:hypothetical protein [Candidatus Erginobacter occultus]